jgi:hypothetical protein
MLDTLKSDKDAIVQRQADYIKDCETNLSQLATEKADAEKAKAVALKKAAEAETRVTQREGTIRDLEEKLRNLVVSNDPDAIITDLHKYGLRSIHRR